MLETAEKSGSVIGGATLRVSRSGNIIFVVYLHMGYDNMSIVAQLSHWVTSRCGDGGR